MNEKDLFSNTWRPISIPKPQQSDNLGSIVRHFVGPTFHYSDILLLRHLAGPAKSVVRHLVIPTTPLFDISYVKCKIRCCGVK